MKKAFSICVALSLLLVLGLASSAPLAAVQPPITVEVTNPIAWELSDYIIKFKTGELLLGPADYVDIMFPTGTDLTTVTSVTVTVPATVTTYTVIGTNLRIVLAAGEAIGWGVDVTIVVEDVTNPAPGDYGLCVGTSNSSPICSGDADIVAAYEVTMAVDPVAGGTAFDMTDESPYEAGAVVSIKAEADTGYQFVNWTATPGVVFADSDSMETTFIMPDEAVTITANFEPMPTYTLTMAVAPVLGGVATDETGADSYEAGATVAIKAVASPGYRFANWTAAPEGVFDDAYAAETNFIMPDKAVTVTANFVAVCQLTISSTTGGSVIAPGEGKFDYSEGTVVSLVAEAEEFYQFVGWTGDVDDIPDADAESTNITMNGDYSITATFGLAGGCFVATAAYGTPMAEEIQILRDFRDKYLLTNLMGKTLVEFYYSVSPPIAEFIAEHPSLKPITRVGLRPAVAVSAAALNTTLAEKMAMAGLLALVSVALALWATRRRGRCSNDSRG